MTTQVRAALLFALALSACGGGGGGGGGSTPGSDTTPNAFSFSSASDVSPGSVQTSNTVTISGIDAAAPVSVTGGSYDIGCDGGFTGAAGSITNNQTICVRHTAPASFATATITTLTVGGVSGSYASTTRAASGPITDDDARRAVLSDLGEDLILPTLRDLDTRSAALATLVAALAAAPANAAARSAAQDGWRTAMVAVERAEVLQIGPAARSSEPGGQNLRDQIYSYPLLARCGVHNAAYADEAVTGSTLINRTGMGALEYLLFDDTANLACLPAAGVNGQAKRAQHAGRIAARIAVVATQLRNAWELAGGNFLLKFGAAGTSGNTMPFSTPQMALDALSTAIFYVEKETKDRKIASPTGIGATGLLPCAQVSCPERVESVFARGSGDHIRANILAFRDVFTGVSGGLGLNALLEGIDREDLATKIVAEVNAALTGGDATLDDFETAVEDIESRAACTNASSTRTGEPACALHGLVDQFDNTLRADITSTLNLKIPDTAAGDND
ncbi:MAG: imelysin family protein [Panacagrimonas sp.]